MNYQLLKDVLDLVQTFENQKPAQSSQTADIEDFKCWVAAGCNAGAGYPEADWKGKENGRSPESVINTLILHLSRYAKAYSKAAIHNSGFSTQEDFIYLISLRAFGAMSKMTLIKTNVQEKPAGMQIINRLINAGWVEQTDSETDKRSKVIRITSKGLAALDSQMDAIRCASAVVTGNLTKEEKMALIRLLSKLDDFHNPLYCRNLKPEMLLEEAFKIKQQD